MQRKLWIIFTFLLILSFGLGTSALAQEPTPTAPNAMGTAFTYQGQLKDTNGPVTGNCDFHFGLWDAVSDGNQVGSLLEQSYIAISEGLFTTQLDFGVNAFDGNPRWIEIAVRCPSGGGDFTTLTPRQPLAPAPNGLFSANADTLGGLPSSAFAAATHDHWGESWSGKDIGLTLSEGSIGVFANGALYGLYGQSDSTDGSGVYGLASAADGNTYGVYGQSDSSSGYGMYGYASAASGTAQGVVGITNAPGTNVRGFIFYSAGVQGGATSTTGPAVGVWGQSASTSGRGVYGNAWAASGTTYGVYGSVESPSGYAGYFTSPAGNGVTINVPAGKTGLNVTSGNALVAGNTIWHAGNDGSGSALDADLLDGQHAAAFQRHYQNLVVVAKSGGDYTTITAALNSITDASATNPYLIYVAPGVYTEIVTMKPYVDIEGAGEDATKITYSSPIYGGTVNGANHAELRFLTVENTGGDSLVIAISIPPDASASTSLVHVTARASGTETCFGIYIEQGSPTLTDVTASASGCFHNYGVQIVEGDPTLVNVTALASGGSYSYGVVSHTGGNSPTMRDLTVIVTNAAVENYGVFSVSSSPTLINASIMVTGTTSVNYGIYNGQSVLPLKIDKATVTVSGGRENYGVYNLVSPSTLAYVTINVSGGSNTYGVWNESSSCAIWNSTISASGGSNANDGIHNAALSGSYTVTINASQITGGSSTIYQDSHYTTKIGASQLTGNGAFPVSGTTYVCVASYDGNYNPVNAATCNYP